MFLKVPFLKDGLQIPSFHLSVHFGKNLALHDLVHHLSHQVGQVELVVNVHGKVHYYLKAKTKAKMIFWYHFTFYQDLQPFQTSQVSFSQFGKI